MKSKIKKEFEEQYKLAILNKISSSELCEYYYHNSILNEIGINYITALVAIELTKKEQAEWIKAEIAKVYDKGNVKIISDIIDRYESSDI